MVARKRLEIDPAELPTAIYCRISQQYATTEESLDSQERLNLRWCAERNYVVPPDFIFREKDSGYETADDRTVLVRLRELVRQGKVGRVIAYNTDRLSREPIELLSLIKEFRQGGCKTEFVLFDVDPSTPQGKVALFIRGFADEIEWTQIAERTTRKRREIRASGRRVGENGPVFGYRWVRDGEGRITKERAWEPDPKAAEWVRLIFDLIVTHGYSMRQVAVELNARGVPTPSVYRGYRFKDGRTPKWDSSSVRLRIVEEAYKGVVYHNKSVMVRKKRNKALPKHEWIRLPDAPTPPLVDPATWEKAQACIKSNDIIGQRRKAAAKTRNEKEFAFLRGVIYCGTCGKPMRAVKIKRWNKATKRKDLYDLIYRCGSRRYQAERGTPEESRCYGRAVYDWKVREAIWAKAWGYVTDSRLIQREYDRLKEDRPGEDLFRDSLKAAEDEVKACERKATNLVKSMANEDDADVRKLIRQEIEVLKTEKARHVDRAERLRAKLKVYEAMDRKAEEMIERSRQIREGDVAPPETWPERRAFLDWLGARVIGNGETLTLRLDSGLGTADLRDDSSVVVSREFLRSSSRCTAWSPP
jgi:DNA invertase Pin-like site-specific DNA recombinase